MARYKVENKEQTKARIIAAAGRSFRKGGYNGIGVDGLAKEAGVTSGAFYGHFGSKVEAFEVALATGLDEVIEGVQKFQREHGVDWVKAFAEYYLGKPHQNDMACGCAMATLTTEVVRSDVEAHAIFEKKMTAIVDLVARGLTNGSDEDRRARAWSMLSVLIGGINVARAMKSTKASEKVAESIKIAAIKAAGRTRATVRNKP